jgi:type I restriction-modification system DNA methylase subunit
MKFDVIVGNPPYTRQEEISEISPEDSEYKEKTIKSALFSHDTRVAKIGKRAGIYAYFFVHGTKFLKEGGYFGFIVLNSWLDVDYGKDLQEFFLGNYKIIAVIESKVERWFEDADINTCIVILKKCKDEKERDENNVRFPVCFFKKAAALFYPTDAKWGKYLRAPDIR